MAKEFEGRNEDHLATQALRDSRQSAQQRLEQEAQTRGNQQTMQAGFTVRTARKTDTTQRG